MRDSSKRIVALLLVFAIFATMGGFFVLIGGLVGNQIGMKGMSTLPNTFFILSAVLHVSFYVKVRERYGQKRVLILIFLYSLGFIGAGSLAVLFHNIWLLLLTGVMLGGVNSGTQRIRFIIQEESATAEGKRRLLSLLMFLPIFSSLFGPQIGRLGADLFSIKYLGSFLGMLAIPLLSLPIILLSGFSSQNSKAEKKESQEEAEEKISEEVNNENSEEKKIHKEGILTPFQAILASGLGFMLMSLMMVPISIQIVQRENYPLEIAQSVIVWHLIAMYSPSALTFLFKKISLITYARLGYLLYLIAGGVAFIADSPLLYHLTLFLVGVAWNFLYFAGTSSVAQISVSRGNQRLPKLHDQVVFILQAIGSGSSGLLLLHFGWKTIAIVATVLAILGSGSLLRSRKLPPSLEKS